MDSKENDIEPGEYTVTDGGFIRVIVGTVNREFLIHKQLACSRIPFFEKCVGSGNFKESQENTVELLEEDPDVFALIVNWLYNKNIGEVDESKQKNAVKAYLLADKLCAPACKNQIIDAIRSYHFNGMVYIDSFKWLCSLNLPHDMPLWNYYLDEFSYELGSHSKAEMWVDENVFNLNEQYQQLFKDGGIVVVELIKRIVRRRTDEEKYGQEPCEGSGCYYHDHNDGSKC